jgi:hypothetical protein
MNLKITKTPIINTLYTSKHFREEVKKLSNIKKTSFLKTCVEIRAFDFILSFSIVTFLEKGMHNALYYEYPYIYSNIHVPFLS